MYNQNETINALKSRRLNAVVKKQFLRRRNFSLLFILFITLRTIASSDIVLSNKHPKYLTLECCLI